MCDSQRIVKMDPLTCPTHLPTLLHVHTRILGPATTTSVVAQFQRKSFTSLLRLIRLRAHTYIQGGGGEGSTLFHLLPASVSCTLSHTTDLAGPLLPQVRHARSAPHYGAHPLDRPAPRVQGVGQPGLGRLCEEGVKM